MGYIILSSLIPLGAYSVKPLSVPTSRAPSICRLLPGDWCSSLNKGNPLPCAFLNLSYLLWNSVFKLSCPLWTLFSRWGQIKLSVLVCMSLVSIQGQFQTVMNCWSRFPPVSRWYNHLYSLVCQLKFFWGKVQVRDERSACRNFLEKMINLKKHSSLSCIRWF